MTSGATTIRLLTIFKDAVSCCCWCLLSREPQLSSRVCSNVGHSSRHVSESGFYSQLYIQQSLTAWGKLSNLMCLCYK